MVNYEDYDQKYKNSASFLQPLHKKFNSFDELYWGVLNYRNNPWKSKVVDPEVFEKVERVTSHAIAAKPRGKVVAGNDKAEEMAAVVDEFLKWQSSVKGQNLLLKAEKGAKTAYKYGIGFFLMTWKFERTKKNGKYETSFDCWHVQDLNIYDCFPDPSATSLEDMEYFILNEYTTLDRLEAENVKIDGESRYFNLKELKKRIQEDSTEDTTNVKGSASYSRNVPLERDKVRKIRGFTDDKANGRILVRRCFEKKKWVTIVPDYELVIEDRESPFGFIPVLAIIDQTVEGQLYGIGEIEPIASLQRGLWNVVNQRMDTVRLIMNSPIKVRASSKYAPTWVMKPGAIWKMDDMNDAEVVSIPDTTAATFAQTAGYFKDSMAKAGGFQDFLTRNDTSKEKTAREVTASQEEQNSRLRTKEQHIDYFVESMMRMAMELNKIYVKTPQLIRVIGRDSVKALMNVGSESVYKGEVRPKFLPSDTQDYGYLVVEPEDLFNDFDYIVETGSTLPLDPTVEAGNLVNMIYLMMKLQPNLQQEGVQIKFGPLLEKLMSRSGVKNIDQVLVNQSMGMANMAGMTGMAQPDQMGQEQEQPLTPEQIQAYLSMLQSQPNEQTQNTGAAEQGGLGQAESAPGIVGQAIP